MTKTTRRDVIIGAGTLATASSLAMPALAQGKKYDDGASDTVIKIGNTNPYSGNASTYGLIGKTIEATFKMVNDKGGINGRKIEVIAYDGKTDPQLTATFASRCAEDDKALMIIGGSPSATAAAMIPVAAQNAIPYYMLSASANNLTDNAVWHFRFGPRAAQDGIAVADAFVELGIKKVAVINNSTPFGTDGAKSTIQALEAKGIKVVTQQTYDAAATDVSPQVINLRQADADVILAFPYPADGARVARTIRQLGIKSPIVMPRVGIMAAFLKLAGEAADGVLVPTSVDVTRPEVAKLYADYNAKYKPIQPSPSPAQGYDAATVAVKVLSDAEVQKAINSGNLAAARTAIRDATQRVGKFEGMQGQKGVGYMFGTGLMHHGVPDRKFFVFAEVAGKGEKIIAADMSKLKPKN